MAAFVIPNPTPAQWVDGVYNIGMTITINPGTYATGGILCNLNEAAVKASRTPSTMAVYGQSGYIYAYVKGTDNSNGLLKIFVQDGVATDALQELGNGTAIPAGVLADVIHLEGRYKGME